MSWQNGEVTPSQPQGTHYRNGRTSMEENPELTTLPSPRLVDQENGSRVSNEIRGLDKNMTAQGKCISLMGERHTSYDDL